MVAGKADQEVDRLNKDQANFLKARICLFEGTFRKYHTELGLQDSANKWLEEAVKACETLLGKYSLYNIGEDTYWKCLLQSTYQIIRKLF